ncbi:Olfactory receptor-like protein OLF4 [Pteropus alecto]|uniref:Olfactory receptor-like protein OLF4 n=1 Tax=Pteropus alecto TaxID=9402 RepID=L5K8S7_PTEAL|nr:Olfactory receptor-like protein OLF4 [Pteropus alecto]
MLSSNDTRILKFLLQGFSEEPELQPLIFGFFLSMYLITVFGNLLIILAVSSDSRLHTPMYFFLCNLSLVDICFTSSTVPKMLVNIQTQSKVITYKGCIAQMYFSTFFGLLDDFLLTVMAYDRFVAICHPLHYTVIMNPRFCGLLLLMSWIIGALSTLLHSLLVLRLSFSTDVEIPQYFCEINQLAQNRCFTPSCCLAWNRASVSIMNHPGSNSDFQTESSLSETQSSHFHHMEPENLTRGSEFLLGLSEESEQQPLIFGLFLSMYLIAMVGNLLIILAVSSDSHLHTPMYFFLCNLSLVDICFTSTNIPKMLMNILTQRKVITYEDCITQMYFLLLFAVLGVFLLTVMAYD